VGQGWQHKIRRYKDEDGKHRAELLSQGTYGITGLLLRGIINAEENSGADNPNKAAFDIRMDKTLTPYYIRKVKRISVIITRPVWNMDSEEKEIVKKYSLDIIF
jgi:hypothetical protein